MTTVEDVLRKKLGEEPIAALARGEPHSFVIPVRGKHNSFYSDGVIKQGYAVHERRLNDIAEIKKYFQTTILTAKLLEELNAGKRPTQRHLFYMADGYSLPNGHTPFDHEQADSNNVLQDIEQITGIFREDLNIVTEPQRSRMAGDFTLTYRPSNIVIDVAQLGRANMFQPIPSRVDDYSISFRRNPKFVLLAEKGAIFNSLAETKFYERNNCILITGGGRPDRPTRRLVRRLHDEHHLPVFVLTDADPWGFDIFFNYAIGTMSLSYESSRLAVPDAVYLGVSFSDLMRFNVKGLMPAQATDIKRAEEMLEYEWVKQSEFWSNELALFLRMKRKAEIDALPDLDGFLRSKLAERGIR